MLAVFGICLYGYMTEKYRPEPDIEPRASCLAYERSTTELSRSIQLIVCAECHPRAVLRVRVCVRGTCM